MNIDNNAFLEAYKDYSMWICWQAQPVKTSTGEKRKTKRPKGKHGNIDITDPGNLMTYDQAVDVRTENDYTGISFVVDTLEAPLLAVDLDHVVDDEYHIPREVYDFLQDASEVAYIEFSPSCDGLHAIIPLETPFTLSKTRIKSEQGEYEFYTQKRMITFTSDDFLTLYSGEKTLQIPEDPEEDQTLEPLPRDEAIMLLELLGYDHDEEAIEDEEETTEDEAKHSTGLTDEAVIALICRDETRSRLYHGDRSKYATEENDGASEADQALANHIAFFSGDQKQTRRILRSSPLGQREKVQNRPDYVARTGRNSFRGRTVFYDKNHHKKGTGKSRSIRPDERENPSEDASEAQRDPFFYTKHGMLEKTEENLNRAFSFYNTISNRLEFDTFAREYYIDGNPAEEGDMIDLRSQVVDADPRFSYVTETLFEKTWLKIAKHKNSFHKTADWIRGNRDLVHRERTYPAIPEHDGTPRVKEMLNIICGYPEDPEERDYRREVSRALMKGLVARIIYPGCDFQMMIIFEGKSGIGKTTLIRKTLLPEGLAHTTDGEIPAFFDRDFKLKMQKKHILGIEEARIDHKKDQDAIKAAVTSTEVEERGMYEKETEVRGISYIILASTNYKTYLTNEPGTRRYIPVKIYREEGEHMHLQWLEENRPQILAEARDMVEADMKKYGKLQATIKSDFVEKIRESVTSMDRVDEVIREYIDHKGWENIIRDGITWKDVYASDESFSMAYRADQKTSRLINNAISQLEEFEDTPRRGRRQDPVEGKTTTTQVYMIDPQKKEELENLHRGRTLFGFTSVYLREFKRELKERENQN